MTRPAPSLEREAFTTPPPGSLSPDTHGHDAPLAPASAEDLWAPVIDALRTGRIGADPGLACRQ